RVLAARLGGDGELRAFVGEHDRRVADADLGVHHLAVGAGHAEQLGRAERLLVEVQRLRGTVDDEVRGDGVIPVGDRLDWHGEPSAAAPTAGTAQEGTYPANPRRAMSVDERAST